MGDRQLAELLRERGIDDERVLGAIASLSRADFVPDASPEESTSDYPIPIGYGQTISQPYIVAFMSQALELRGDERVLEIGTGSGYQTAVLARLCAEVYSIEIVPELAQSARAPGAAGLYQRSPERGGWLPGMARGRAISGNPAHRRAGRDPG